MGEGGQIVIVNATASNWTHSGGHSYQMPGWNFPAQIPAWGRATVYVEWDEGILTHVHDDGGEAEYTIDATGEKFEFQARWPGGSTDRRIQVWFKGIAVNGLGVGATSSFGWAHDGRMNFMLTGRPGQYFASPVLGTVPWVRTLATAWGANPARTLKQICLAGSHDSGMSSNDTHTAFGKPCNTITQTNTVAGQLSVGVRYFDLRPARSAGTYVTGHYSNIKGVVDQGANGQSIDSVVDDVNAFLSRTPDLVVLKFSHDVNTDVPNGAYRPLTPLEYVGRDGATTDPNNLMTRLRRLNNRYTAAGKVPDLTKVPITQLLPQNGQGGVLVVCDPGNSNVEVTPSDGFHQITSFPLRDAYAGSNDVTTMWKDQTKKLGAALAAKDDAFFVLSWMLTQSDAQAGVCDLARSDIPQDLVSTLTFGLEHVDVPDISVRGLAKGANPLLYDMLWTMIAPPAYPNLLNIDDVTTTEAALMAAGITYMATARPAAVAVKVVALRARANGRIVCADSGGNSSLIANRASVGIWETFLMITYPNDVVGLMSYANGRAVCAESGGVKALIANRAAIGPWESFKLQTNPDTSVSFKSVANGRWVCADNVGTAPLIANRDSVGTWERFDLLAQ